MTCPQCGHHNAAGVAVCASCATPLANLCPNCAFKNPRGFKFCGNCGINLLTATLARTSQSEKLRRVQGVMPSPLVDKILHASKHIEGERRTVTVLFSDVVGFTTISEKLDPEAVYNIVDATVAAFRDEIYAHEGTLDKFMGDGVMALFGAPVMHEDDPTRAVRCALGMQDALQRINEEMVAQHHISLQMRLGLNLGTVVVGDIGADLRMNYTALGDTVNVASRLQSVAEPGTILVSRAVYEQTRALFDYTELGSIRLKGRIEPVEIFQVLGLKREPGRIRGIPGLSAPMVGRERELAQMQHVVETLARDGQGGVILITGDAGMGKSRLTGELTQWIARTPELKTIRVYQGGCTAYGQSAYDVQVQILGALFELKPEDSAAACREKIKTGVRNLVRDGALFDILPYIENLMGVPSTERQLAARIRHLEPVQLRQQTFLAVRDLLVHAARVQPLFLVFEDLHWADKPSLDMLLFLRGAVEEAPIVLACISRAGDNQAVLQLEQLGATSSDGQFLHITLEPLSLQESAALVDLLLTITDLPESLRQMIPQRAEGNPFYLEEIIRAMIDRNIIRRRNDRWELTPGADALAFQVPRTLESLIMTRMDHLSESTRFTAQCAAVIGREFSDTILYRIADTNLSRVESDLQELVDHELVNQTDGTNERHFAFQHILTQQTVYNSVLLRRREQLHQKIAGVIEELYADRLDDQAERLAFHYSESKDADRALPHVIRAAARAAARFANEEALAYYRRALGLASRTQAASEVRTRILIGLGDSQTHIGDFEGAANSLRAAWDLARSVPASPMQSRQTAEIARRLGRGFERRGKYDDAMEWLESALREINRDASSGQAVERVRIYLEIGWVHYRRGNLDEAEHWRLRALEISEGLDYYAEMGSAYNGLAALHSHKGDWNRAIDYAQRGLRIREMIGDVEGMSRSHSNLGAILLNVGEWDRALPHLRQSLELKQRIGDAKQLALAHNNLGYYYLLKGDLTQGRGLFSSARKQAEKIRDPNATCLALNSLAQIETLEGNYGEASELLERSISMAQQSGVRDWLAEGKYLMAEVELLRGRLPQALAASAEALLLAQSLGIRQTEINALRVLGAVERVSREWELSIEHLTSSQRIAMETTSPFESARAELELGLLYLDMERFEQARVQLERSRQTFTELGAAHYAQRAHEAQGAFIET